MSKKDKKKSKKNKGLDPFSGITGFTIYTGGKEHTSGSSANVVRKAVKDNPDEFKVAVTSEYRNVEGDADLTLLSIWTAAEQLKSEIYSMVGFSNTPKLKGAVRYCVESVISPEQIFNSLYSKTYRMRLIEDIIDQAKGMIYD